MADDWEWEVEPWGMFAIWQEEDGKWGLQFEDDTAEYLTEQECRERIEFIIETQIEFQEERGAPRMRNIEATTMEVAERAMRAAIPGIMVFLAQMIDPGDQVRPIEGR